jgi:hypothetical protein
MDWMREARRSTKGPLRKGGVAGWGNKPGARVGGCGKSCRRSCGTVVAAARLPLARSLTTDGRPCYHIAHNTTQYRWDAKVCPTGCTIPLVPQTTTVRH